MKTIYLVRHAKSAWSVPGLGDIDRPLNERGYADAYEMAKRIRKKFNADLLISSPATRAVSTALIFARVLELDASRIEMHSLLYDTSAKQYSSVIASLPDECHTVLLFGHNPVITESANLLGGAHLDDMATCGIVGIEFDSRTWKQATQTGGKFIFYDFPKNDGA